MRQELSAAKAAARQAQEHLVDTRSKLDDLARQLAEANEHSRQRVELEVKNALLAAAKEEAERVQAEANARLRQRDVGAMGVHELEAAVDAMRKTCDVMRASERALREEVESARAVLGKSVTDAELVAAGYNPKAAPVSINVYIPLLNRKITEALKDKEREGERGQRLLQHLQHEAAELAAKLEAADSERAAHAKHARAFEQVTSQLRGEIERARSYLDEKLGKSEQIKSLSAQIAELVRRLQETESHGQWLESQLQHATQSLDEAGFELDRFQGAQKAERARLVQLTIEALGQLRQHLTYSLCGLRTSQQTPNPHEALAWKRASGLVAPRGDLLDVVVRFIPPSKSNGAVAGGSIHPAERTASASAHRHHRFDQTSFSPRPSLFYDDGAPPPLPPVQVSNPNPNPNPNTNTNTNTNPNPTPGEPGGGDASVAGTRNPPRDAHALGRSRVTSAALDFARDGPAIRQPAGQSSSLGSLHRPERTRHLSKAADPRSHRHRRRARRRGAGRRDEHGQWTRDGACEHSWVPHPRLGLGTRQPRGHRWKRRRRRRP